MTVAVRHKRLRGAKTALRAVEVLQEHRGDFELTGSVLGEPTLSIVFLTDGALAALHGQFLDDPTPTDVITFPGDPTFGPGGEICVSVDAARRQPGRAFSDELTLYLVHGWLHLAGHDDLQPVKKRRMRRAEQKALALLRSAGAMPRFTIAPTSR